MSQLLLNDTALARNTDPATSYEAAETVRVKKHGMLVLDILYRAKTPLTHKQIVEEAARQGYQATAQSLRSRCSELVKAQMVEADAHTVRGNFGRKERRWVITSEGVTYYRHIHQNIHPEVRLNHG